MFCRKSQSYYRLHIRENFLAHDDEVEPGRLKEIVEKAQKDADWVLQKVS